MCKLNIFDKLSFLFLLIGSIDYGLMGLVNINILNFIFMGIPIFEKIFSFLVCLSAFNLILLIFRCDIVNLDD